MRLLVETQLRSLQKCPDEANEVALDAKVDVAHDQLVEPVQVVVLVSAANRSTEGNRRSRESLSFCPAALS